MKLSAWEAVRRASGRVGENKRLIAILWVANLCLAAMLAAPMFTYLNRTLGHSRVASEMLNDLDPMFLIELFAGVNDATRIQDSISLLLLSLGALFLWSVVFAAGAIGRLANGGGFFEEAGRHFWRYIRLFLVFIPCLLLLTAVNGGLSNIADKLWGDGMRAAPLVKFDWFRQGVMILLFGWLLTGFDYAKVRLANGRNRSAIAAAFGGVWFVTANLRRTMGAWLTVSVFGFLFLLLWSVGEHFITNRSMGAVLLLLGLQQLYVLSRIWVRLMYWGAAVEIEGEEWKKANESKTVYEYVAGRRDDAVESERADVFEGTVALGEAEGPAAG